jgi:hypothetical protein
MIRCGECDMPQPDDELESLHLEDCSQHDDDTCLACDQLEEESG